MANEHDNDNDNGRLEQDSTDPTAVPPSAQSSPPISAPPAPSPTASPTLPLPSPVPQTPPATATSPDGSITYTATDSTPTKLTIGSGPELGVGDPTSFTPPPPRRSRSTYTGSAGKPQRRGGFLGFLGRWFRFRLAMGLVALLIVGGVGLFVNSNSTSAGRLDPGDCFEIPDTGRVNRVTDQDCSLPHEAQIYAEVTGTSSDSADKCFEAFLRLTEDPAFAPLPADVGFATMEGTVRHSCVVQSPSGQLVGSVLD